MRDVVFLKAVSVILETKYVVVNANKVTIIDA
jgi:hypothetical protein